MLIDTWHLQVSKTVFKVWENSEPQRLLKELWVNAKYNNHFHSECKHYNHSLKFDSEVRFLERGDEVMSSECVRIYAVSQSFFTFFFYLITTSTELYNAHAIIEDLDIIPR